jgi:hypothetical protein
MKNETSKKKKRYKAVLDLASSLLSPFVSSSLSLTSSSVAVCTFDLSSTALPLLPPPPCQPKNLVHFRSFKEQRKRDHFPTPLHANKISRASSQHVKNRMVFLVAFLCLVAFGLWCEVFCHSVVCSSILEVSIISQKCFEIVTRDKCDDRERSNFGHYLRLTSATPCHVRLRQDVESVVA